MAHDPTSSDSDSIGEMPFSPQITQPPNAGHKRPVHRKVKLNQPDESLVDKTRAQIRELIQEVHQLAADDRPTDEFYEGFLTRIVTALASVGGAIWVRDDETQSIDLKYHVNLKQTSLADRTDAQQIHAKLIQKVFTRGEASLVPPDTRSDADSAGNPTESLLVIAPLKVNGETIGLVEIFQRPGAGPSTQRGYLRFLLQMCDVAGEFLSRKRIRCLQEKQKLFQQMQRFAQLVHRRLDVRNTVYAIANEGRRLIDCDRVSVGTMVGKRCVIKTVSGLDTIERRSEQVKSLNRLTTAVVRTRKPLWFHGDTRDLPPKIEKRVKDHVEKSHARMLAIVPLVTSKSVDESAEDPFASIAHHGGEKPIGVIVVEQLGEATVSPEARDRIDIVAAHAQTALANSIDHQSIFLMPLWRFIGKLISQFRGDRIVRTAIVAGLMAGLAAFLSLYPWPFTLGASGSLVPQQQREIFAQLDGRLTEINVSNTGDSIVQEGDLLAQMVSSQLEQQIGDLQGRIEQAKKEMESAMIGKRMGDDPQEQRRSSLEFLSAERTIQNFEAELQVKLKDRELLNVKAPISGQVVNWQVRQNLLRRPVRFGQHLMTIIPEDSQWLIELEMPERKLAHLTRMMNRANENIKVTFALVSWPGKEFEGELISVDQKLDVYSDEGNAALVRVKFPNDQIPSELLRSGTRVTGKVHCGNRSIGYAMFYELIETVQAKWQFWF